MHKDLILADRSVIKLTGSDRHSFLDGLVTNRISADGALTYAGLLTPQGKYLFDFLVFQDTEALYLDHAAEDSSALMQRLMLYKLRADVTIENISDQLAVMVSESVLEGNLAAPDPRHIGLGWRALVPAAAGTTDPDARSAHDGLRRRLGVHGGPVTLKREKDFWLETGAERLAGVAFDKGCFVGQELTARMKHRMDLKKLILPFAYTGTAPEVGAAVLNAHGKAAGDVREAAEGTGLALIRLAEAEAVPLLAGDTEIALIPLSDA